MYEKVSNLSDSSDETEDTRNPEKQFNINKENITTNNLDNTTSYVEILRETSPNLHSNEIFAAIPSRFQNRVLCVSTEKLIKSPEGDTYNECMVETYPACGATEANISTSLKMSKLIDFFKLNRSAAKHDFVESYVVISDQSAVQKFPLTNFVTCTEIPEISQVQSDSLEERSNNSRELPGRSKTIVAAQDSER